jgi:predicted nucleic acid-binding protein
MEKKLKIYIDTSVIGGCYDEEFSEWSNLLFEEFREGKKIAVISDITLEELEKAPQKVRDILDSIPKMNINFIALNIEAEHLADLYIQNKIITKKFLEDARHIALASISNADVLVSWNFKHIVNLDRIRNYNSVNLKYGYRIIEIRTPREVLNEKR